uniref:Uncharacterized protein n=1 Tax=Arundo donax TaxID=35708 RepID=A0A0A9EJA3_ARUDO
MMMDGMGLRFACAILFVVLGSVVSLLWQCSSVPTLQIIASLQRH